MKKIIALLPVLTMAITLCACGGPKEPEKETAAETVTADTTQQAETGPQYDEKIFKLGTTSADGSLVANTFVEFGKRLSEKTDGKLGIDVYPGSVLGSANEMIQSTQQGTLDFAVMQPASLADMGASKMNLLTLPYLFEDYNQYVDTLFSEIGDEILKDVTDNVDGLIGLGYLPDGGRVYFTCGAAIRSLEDIKNMKIRLQGNAIDTDTANALGFSATPVAMAELYSALDTGVVDGAENSVSTIDGSAFYEVIDYITLDNHTYNLPVLLFSEKNWVDLTDDTKTLIKETWDSVIMDYYVPSLTKTEEELLLKFEKNGVEVIRELADKEKWVEAVAPVWEKYGAGIEDLVADVQKK